MRFLSLLLAALLPATSFAAECGFEEGCSYDKDLCVQTRALDKDVDALLRAGASDPKPDEPALVQLDGRYRQVLQRAKDDIYTGNADVASLGSKYDCLRGKLNELTIGVLPMTLKAAEATIAELEKRAAALDAKAGAADCAAECKQALSRELDALDAEGSRAWRHVHNASLSVDDMSPWGVFYQKLPDGSQKEVKNPSEAALPYIAPLNDRVAALSQTLQAIAVKLGRDGSTPKERRDAAREERAVARFHDPFAQASAVGDGTGGAAFVRGSAGGKRPALALGAASPTLLDLKHAPPPPTKRAPPPPQDFLPNWFQRRLLGRHDVTADRADLDRILDLRDAGKTTTIGDPGGRAPLTFKQTGNTCAIAAQIVVMKDAGVVPRDADPHKLEDELYAKAVRLGYIDGAESDPDRRATTSTEGRYVGDLLPMAVTKKVRATPVDLQAAVRRGKTFMVPLDTALLWNDPRFKGGHIVAVTGAEADPQTGMILGYYIDDTGLNQAGRLVPAKQFYDAWKANGAAIVEPQ